MNSRFARSGDGFLHCSDGHVRWGLFGAAGVVFVVDEGDGPRVMLQRRSAFAHEGGTWSCAGGALDEGETPLEGGLREASEEVGVVPSDISARDGSGLSFYNLITPRAIVRILTEMRQMPWGEQYRDAMAEPGEDGSTLQNRLAGLEGRVFAKTGTISNVNSLSGYLLRDDGQEIVFAILSNGSGMPASRVRRSIDEIVRALSR